MPVSFEKIKVGGLYERPYLADIWGYNGFQAISRGVITPSGSNYIILFVTREKQNTLTQYNDFLDEGLLHWEGEKKHSSDNRIVNTEFSNDEIHLFYREIHHSPFIYYGEVFIEKYNLCIENPSQFVFNVAQKIRFPDLLNEIELHENEFKVLAQTERDAIIKSRIGQGLFRDGVVKLWGYCAVTGLRNLSLLRASHIKPWRDSSNQERLDPMNGLLLQPILDHLFDMGLITLNINGIIIFSPILSQDDIQKIGLTRDLKLRKSPKKLMRYMEYHRKDVFKNS